jgi:hypothetical protein
MAHAHALGQRAHDGVGGVELIRHDRPIEQRQRGGKLVTQDRLHAIARPRAVRHFDRRAEGHDFD